MKGYQRLARGLLAALLLAAIHTSALARPAQPPGPVAAGRSAADLPASAQVGGIYGYGQLLALSCESRSAADWARYFGVGIHEMEFLARLPKTGNPETGFAGDVNGGWGNLPPEGYGVHAGPVARVLRTYGAQARAVRWMTFDQLRAEIAAGRPVIVWVTGHVAPGRGVDLRLDGQIVRVARYEHTVIVVGYDATTLTILDGKMVYRRPVETFLKAWAPLENMAITWDAALEPAGGPRD